MKRLIILILSALSLVTIATAQQRVVDVMDNSPIASATIFDASGSVVGITSTDGDFSEVPASAYPITIRCIGFEQLVIDSLENKEWQMIPIMYELEDAVISAKPQILKQTFYIREYFTLCNEVDTITFFVERMADRFTPASKNVKFSKTSMRDLNARSYAHYKMSGVDSVAVDYKTEFPSMAMLIEPEIEPITPHESLLKSDSPTKTYEKQGKSGVEVIQKLNDQTFTMYQDVLAERKDHTHSIWWLKLAGLTTVFNQCNMTYIYRANDKNSYTPKDLIEASLVMEGDGKGKTYRLLFHTEKPLLIRAMIELYVVDRDYLSKEEAKVAYKNVPTNVKFEIPATVSKLNEATEKLVKRAKEEAKRREESKKE